LLQRFLKENGLKLILRSHEGPDAREGRSDMGSMLEGYTLDHACESGNLMTVFSAPDYPQFVHEPAQRYKNKAAVAVLSAPDWATATMVQYEAVPRPPAEPYYDIMAPDSDEEMEPVPSDASGMTAMTDATGEEEGGLDAAETAHAEEGKDAEEQLEDGREAPKPGSPAPSPKAEHTATQRRQSRSASRSPVKSASKKAISGDAGHDAVQLTSPNITSQPGSPKAKVPSALAPVHAHGSRLLTVFHPTRRVPSAPAEGQE
jgi:hypothetical protein